MKIISEPIMIYVSINQKHQLQDCIIYLKLGKIREILYQNAELMS